MMRKFLIFILVIGALSSFAQTQPTLPPGSQIYSSNLFLAPDSSVWTGKAGLYTNLGSWAQVKALVAIPDATIHAYAADPFYDFSSPSYNTFAISQSMRDKYGDEPRILVQVRKSTDPANEWMDFMNGVQRTRGVNGEVTSVRFQTSGYPAILIICR